MKAKPPKEFYTEVCALCKIFERYTGFPLPLKPAGPLQRHFSSSDVNELEKTGSSKIWIIDKHFRISHDGPGYPLRVRGFKFVSVKNYREVYYAKKISGGEIRCYSEQFVQTITAMATNSGKYFQVVWVPDE